MMNLQECVIAIFIENGLKIVGSKQLLKKTKLLRFKKNHVAYSVVLEHDTCIVHIWKKKRKAQPRTHPYQKVPVVRGGTRAPEERLVVNLHDPTSLDQISKFI